IYMAMSPPVGTLATRTSTVAVATLVIAVMVVLGALASASILTIVLGLALIAFVSSLLPRADPRAASMQLPVLVGFIYSVAHPLSGAPPPARAAAVLLSLPFYVIAPAILFQPAPRQSLVRGAARVLDALGTALDGIRTGVEDAGRD